MKGLFLVATLAAVEHLTAGSAAQASPGGTQRMEIIVEREEGGAWKTVDPGLVFAANDRLRFRFRANFDGYLYVMNTGTTGRSSLLFPREETGRQNRVTARTEYLIPATKAYFRIDGPPGYDVVYWLVTPLSLGEEAQSGWVPLAPPPDAKSPYTLLPRCDEAVLRARGLCVDSNAGPRSVSRMESLPENLAKVPGATSRELVIMRQQDNSLISSPVPLTGPVLYEFRIAHK